MTDSTKPCCRPDCDQLVVRREGECPKDWRKRVHCSRECGNKTRAEKRLARIVAPPPRHCIGCGAEMVREYAESASSFARRQSCGAPECKQASFKAGMAKVRLATSTAIKPCDACGKPTAGRAICHSCAARKVKPPSKADPAPPSIQLGPTWREYFRGPFLPERHPVAEHLRRLETDGLAVLGQRRMGEGDYVYLCKARAG